MANAAVKQDPAALVAEAITDLQRVADAAATLTEPRAGETKGDYVRRMRQERGMSAKQFATAASITAKQAGQAESDPDKLGNLNDWLRIERTLDIPTYTLSHWGQAKPDKPDNAFGRAKDKPHEGETRGDYLQRILTLREMDTEQLADMLVLDPDEVRQAVEEPWRHLYGQDVLWEAIATGLNLPVDYILSTPVHAPVADLSPTMDRDASATPADAAPMPTAENGAVIALAVDQIKPQNYRRTFSTASLTELAQSLAAQGQLQPVLVRPAPGHWALIAGERRWRAAQLGIEQGILPATFTLNATVRTDIDADAHVLASLVENLQREDVPPLEEAEALALARKRWSATEIAKAISKTPRFIQQRLALVEKLSGPTKQALADGDITVTFARLLARVGPATQAELLVEIRRGYFGTAKQLEERIQRLTFDPDKAIFSPLLYNGPTITDEDNKLWYTDLGLVKKLQLEAAKDKAAELRQQGYGYVEVIEGGHFSAVDGGYYMQERNLTIRKGDRPLPAGAHRAAIIAIKNDLSVEIHANLVRTDTKPTSPKAKAAAAGTIVDPSQLVGEGQRLYAEKARTRALQAAIMRDEQAQMAVVAIGMLQKASWGQPISFRDEHWPPHRLTVLPALSEQLQEVLDTYPGLLADLTKEPRGGVGDRLDKAEHPQVVLWHTLMTMEYEDLVALIGLLAAARVMAGNGGFELGEQDLCIAMADSLNVQMDVKWQIDAEYLSTLKKPQLIALAHAIGMFTMARQMADGAKKEHTQRGAFTGLKMAAMAAAILDYVQTHNIRYVPPELRFLRKDEAVERTRAELADGAPCSWIENGPADPAPPHPAWARQPTAPPPLTPTEPDDDAGDDDGDVEDLDTDEAA
jgi:ParB family chromosome partitioning protein